MTANTINTQLRSTVLRDLTRLQDSLNRRFLTADARLIVRIYQTVKKTYDCDYNDTIFDICAMQCISDVTKMPTIPVATTAQALYITDLCTSLHLPLDQITLDTLVIAVRADLNLAVQLAIKTAMQTSAVLS